MATLFTADDHFGHAEILHALRAGFASIQEHDEMLIEAWNATVAPGDTVYHLGDFALSTPEYAAKVFRRLDRKSVV